MHYKWKAAYFVLTVLKSIITASKSSKHIWDTLWLQYFITRWALTSQIIQSAPICGFNYWSSDSIRKGSCSVQVLCYYSRDLFLITGLLIYGTMSNPLPQMATWAWKSQYNPESKLQCFANCSPTFLEMFLGAATGGGEGRSGSLPGCLWSILYIWLKRKGQQGGGSHFSIVYWYCFPITNLLKNTLEIPYNSRTTTSETNFPCKGLGGWI